MYRLVPKSMETKPVGLRLERFQFQPGELHGHGLVGVFRHQEDVSLRGPLKGPLQDGHELFGAKKAGQHEDKQRGGALDEHPPQVFEMLEKGFYGTAFDLLVLGSNFFVAFRHDQG